MLNVFIVLYYSCCAGYGAYSLLKRRENGLIKTLFITFFPVLGVILAYYLFKQTKNLSVPEMKTDLYEDGETPDLLEPIKTINAKEEINFVPLQDALLLNDNKTKRKLLIHSLKENDVQNPAILKAALENDDTETSHYAATSIMEMKRKLQNSIQQLSAALKEDPDNFELITSYAAAIKKYLDSGFLDEGSYHRYQSLFSTALESVLERDKSETQYFVDKINCDLKIGHYGKALLYSKMFLAEHSLNEHAYIMAMKVHYSLQDQAGLQKVIRNLKKQPVHLSAKSLDIIRYWSKEDNIG